MSTLTPSFPLENHKSPRSTPSENPTSLKPPIFKEGASITLEDWARLVKSLTRHYLEAFVPGFSLSEADDEVIRKAVRPAKWPAGWAKARNDLAKVNLSERVNEELQEYNLLMKGVADQKEYLKRSTPDILRLWMEILDLHSEIRRLVDKIHRVGLEVMGRFRVNIIPQMLTEEKISSSKANQLGAKSKAKLQALNHEGFFEETPDAMFEVGDAATDRVGALHESAVLLLRKAEWQGPREDLPLQVLPCLSPP
ncbi:hypothetical protein HDU97_009907 [Phlyctochytrium planicorne]|nr:hypothetical protein HDU97_009907 [Phlyctochytrium planicorne]